MTCVNESNGNELKIIEFVWTTMKPFSW